MKKCFVIMPFSETTHIKGDAPVKTSKEEWDFIFDKWIKKAVENYPDFECKRSSANPGNFIKGIVQDINDSDIAIADLTGRRPNVFYELGIRHSLRLGTIIITQDIADLPSDLFSYNCFEYAYPKEGFYQPEAYVEFERQLHQKITYILANKNNEDNPVADFLKLEHYYKDREKQEQIEDFKELLKDIIVEINEIFKDIEGVNNKKELMLKEKKINFTFFDITLFDSIFLNISYYDYNEINEEFFENALKHIRETRRIFLHLFQYWQGTMAISSQDNLNSYFSSIEHILKNKSNIIEPMEKMIAEVK